MSPYTLPPLPYDFGALEPHVSGKLMELHYGTHHSAYVTKANEAISELEEARARDDFSGMAALEQALAFNVSGHVLHSIFWRNLRAGGGGWPTGALREALVRDFGTLERFKRQMNAVAASIAGSGWAALVFEPVGARLLVTQIHDHHANVAVASLPLLVMDAWEHAYYLQYQTRKAEFFHALWNVWNWEDVAQRFESARSLDPLISTAERGTHERTQDSGSGSDSGGHPGARVSKLQLHEGIA